MPEKICLDCRQPFNQYSSLQNRCGDCTYKRNIEIAMNSHKKANSNKGSARYKWSKAKQEWIDQNPADENGLWYSHYSGTPLTIDRDLLDMGVEYLSLDHVEPRGSHPDKRYVQSNFVPCTIAENNLKGSRSYEAFCKDFYPHLLDNK